MAPIRLLGLGDNTVDIYVEAGMQYPGGNAVNVAALARRCAIETSYLGCVGNDAAGLLVEAALRAEGVELSRLRRRAGANARALIGHAGGERRFMSADPGVRGDYGWSDEDLAYIGGFDLVHTSINSDLGPALPRIAGAARKLSFDFSERWTRIDAAPILRCVNIAFLSCPGCTAAECEGALRLAIAGGAAIAVATRGAEGAMALAGRGIQQQAVLPTQVTDTLGAGDGFIAAFLVAHLRGDDLAAALAAGARYAAQVCTWHGGFGHGVAWSAADEPAELKG